MITLNTCHAVHPPYGILKCPAGRGQPQFLKHFPRRNAPRTVVMGPSGLGATINNFSRNVLRQQGRGNSGAISVLSTPKWCDLRVIHTKMWC